MPVIDEGSNQMLCRVLFVSDPLCSWCWGMAREIDLAREALAGEVELGLLLGGLGFANTVPMSSEGWARLGNLWARVTATTGQQFRELTESEPEFVFNSKEACRAVLAVEVAEARQAGGSSSGLAFDFLHALQRAFFVRGQPPTDRDVQRREAALLGIDAAAFDAALTSVTDAKLAVAIDKAKGHGSQALPAVLVENSEGVTKLMAGGYVTAEYLLADLKHWLK